MHTPMLDWTFGAVARSRRRRSHLDVAERVAESITQRPGSGLSIGRFDQFSQFGPVDRALIEA